MTHADKAFAKAKIEGALSEKMATISALVGSNDQAHDAIKAAFVLGFDRAGAYWPDNEDPLALVHGQQKVQEANLIATALMLEVLSDIDEGVACFLDEAMNENIGSHWGVVKASASERVNLMTKVLVEGVKSKAAAATKGE